MNFTQWFVIGIVVLLLVYDGIVGWIGQPSESTMIRDWAWQFNTVPFVMGIVSAHWFFPRQSWNNPVVGKTLPFIAILALYDFLWWKYGASEPRWFRYPGMYFLLGMPVGVWLWAAQHSASPIP